MKHAIGNHYEKVVIRHLDWERSESSLSTLDKFLEEVDGRRYNMTFDMIRRKKTMGADK